MAVIEYLKMKYSILHLKIYYYDLFNAHLITVMKKHGIGVWEETKFPPISRSDFNQILYLTAYDRELHWGFK